MVVQSTQVPGHGGRLNEVLGEALLGRGFDNCGRKTVGELLGLRFTDRLEQVA